MLSGGLFSILYEYACSMDSSEILGYNFKKEDRTQTW